MTYFKKGSNTIMNSGEEFIFLMNRLSNAIDLELFYFVCGKAMERIVGL